MQFMTRQLLRGGDPRGSGDVGDPCALARAVWTVRATICFMLAGVKVGMPGGILIILLVGAFDEGTALRLCDLRTNGCRHLKSAPADCAVGFAVVKVNWCSGGGDGDCH